MEEQNVNHTVPEVAPQNPSEEQQAQPKKRKTLKWYSVLFLIFLVAGSIFILKRSSEDVKQMNTGNIFGTSYHIIYYADKNYGPEIYQVLQQVDSSMSIFNKTSVVSAINDNRSAQTDTMLREVYRLSEKISKQTHGAFDITVAPLVNAWGFGFKHNQMPTDAQVDSLKQLVGYQKVRMVNGQIVKQDPRTMLDFGAIAKGYGVDCVVRLLEKKGVHNYMVEIGGEVRIHGHKYVDANAVPWSIGLDKPVEGEDQLQTILPLNDCAVATSGNYRNYYYKNGKRYAHTIDPHSGYPVQHSLLSATVVAPDCATADAYATSFMVMGIEGAKKILTEVPSLKAYLIYADGKEMKVWTNIPDLPKS